MSVMVVGSTSTRRLSFISTEMHMSGTMEHMDAPNTGKEDTPRTRSDVARRLAPIVERFKWMRGMSVRTGDHPSERWMFDGEWWVSDEGDRYQLPDLCAPASLIIGVTNGPDLDDWATRGALVPLLRMASGDMFASVTFDYGDACWYARCVVNERIRVFGCPNEAAAILEALESVLSAQER